MKKHFEAHITPLLNGINLLEASAGTGKTYTIAMLVLRFIIERNIDIKKLLVVTFTKAATEELKYRIRAKLVEAKRAINGQAHGTDDTVDKWLLIIRQKLSDDSIKQRLELALLDIDQAGIFTIHSFCQRMLREHALESGQLFDAELTDDLSAIKQACVDDFWRKQIYTRNLWEISVLTADYKTPDALYQSIANVPSHFLSSDTNIEVCPKHQDINQALIELKRYANTAALSLKETSNIIYSRFQEAKFKDSYCEQFEDYYPQLQAWLCEDNNTMPETLAFELLTTQGIINGLHGGKFRATKTQSSDERKTEYFDSFTINTKPFDELARCAKNIGLLFRRALLESLRLQLNQQLQKLNVLSFDDLISRLASALNNDKKQLLRYELRQRFACALIDEFQDTDDNQWAIFSKVFDTKSHALYLIGDPKQAIYKFRGADIYSYLDAQKKAEHQFTLSKNWRSHPQLVSAVNALFTRPQAFYLKDLNFSPVQPAKTNQDGAIYYKNESIAPLMLWQMPDNGDSYWTAGKAATEIRIAVVNEVLSLLMDNYSLKPQNRRLQPQDIAILVRSNAQARDYQNALREAKIPSVINSTESVFSSNEAVNLYNLLQAVANPSDNSLLKQALALDWFGFTGQQLYQLIHDENRLHSYTKDFLEYYLLWQKYGLMAMLKTLLSQQKIDLNIAKSPIAERQLTNLNHLIELLQQVALEEHLGIHKTIDYLSEAITKASHCEDQQLRLESDDNAVKIITLHRAKGLEYSVVFCPTLWQRNMNLASEKLLINCHIPNADANQLIVDLGSEQFEKHRAIALQEELAEDLRLFYVAMTRAKYRCYLAWVNVRSKEKPNNSAMAYLLNDFAEGDFVKQQSVLKGFADNNNEAFAYRLLNPPHEIAGQYKANYYQDEFKALERQRSLYTVWQMSSYTALSALSIHDAPEIPEDKVNEPIVIDNEVKADELPRGAHTGNVVHDLLEHTSFLELAQNKDITEQREKACLRYGLQLTNPEKLNELLIKVVNTPLSFDDKHFCLKNITDNHCLKEMPFYLAMQTMDANSINTILQDSPSYQPLNSKKMCGYLTGFIDLVCHYKGQYYVMDYKTNSLPDYSEASLINAMREHNYGLQYWLYTVVLHGYLKQRLKNYYYERDFGGVRYLFVRGMNPDITASGVYCSRPDLNKVEALAGVFLGE
ncbi:MAG: exodeoxyribonuclease V subunit beta [Methylococcaceae bacterium]